MFSTTSDIFLAFENDPKAITHSYLDISTNANSFNKQHDINNLLLAEVDSYKHSQWLRNQEKINHENYLKCLNLKHRLNLIAKDEDNFNFEIDQNDNEIITFTSQSIIFLPICIQVVDVNLKNATKTHKSLINSICSALRRNHKINESAI